MGQRASAVAEKFSIKQKVNSASTSGSLVKLFSEIRSPRLKQLDLRLESGGIADS